MMASRLCRRLVTAAASAVLVFGAVDGTVMNRTTGKPQPNLSVSLIQIGEAGMKPAGTVTTDAQGRFRFEDSPQGAMLIQAAHQGVNYNVTTQPGAPSTGLVLEVFDVTRSPGGAEVTQHVILLEPGEKELAATDSFFFSNKGKTTFYDPAGGAVRFFVPDAGKDTIQVTVIGPNNLPLQRAAEKSGAPNTYKVDFPVKPGESRIDVVYRVPYSGSGKFAARLVQKAAASRLVVPAGVTAKGEGLEDLGREPRSQAQIFGIKKTEVEVEVSGAGSIRAAETTAEEEDAGPGIQQILPRVYDRVIPILGITLAILAIGFVMLYRRQAPEPAEPKPVSRGKRRP